MWHLFRFKTTNKSGDTSNPVKSGDTSRTAKSVDTPRPAKSVDTPRPAKSVDTPRPVLEGKVLIESVDNKGWKAESCIGSHTRYTCSETQFLLNMLPQVIQVNDVDSFCAEMRALGCAVWKREEWQGTDAAWSEVEARMPPFRIGKYEVKFMRTVCVELYGGPGGGVRFSLQECKANADFGTDRMNAGGFSTSFDKRKTVTAGDVYRWPADFIKDSWGYSVPAEMLADETVLWPVPPYADLSTIKPPEKPMPAPKTVAKPVSPVKRDLTGRSEAAIRRDDKTRKEATAKHEADARNQLYTKLIPFLERHAKGEDWDSCAKQIFAYFDIPDGAFEGAAKDRCWYISEDSIACTQTWASHSFFDDGSGVRGYSRYSIAYVSSNEENSCEKNTPNGNERRYSGKPVHECTFRVDPFGLRGTYRLRHDSEEEYTD